MDNKKFGFEFLICFLTSIIVFGIIFGIEIIIKNIVNKFGDFYFGFLLIFILPLSSLIGMLIADKIYFKKVRNTILGILLLFISNIVGMLIFISFYKVFIEINLSKSYLDSNLYISFILLGVIGILSSIAGYNLGDFISNKLSRHSSIK